MSDLAEGSPQTDGPEEEEEEREEEERGRRPSAVQWTSCRY